MFFPLFCVRQRTEHSVGRVIISGTCLTVGANEDDHEVMTMMQGDGMDGWGTGYMGGWGGLLLILVAIVAIVGIVAMFRRK